MCKICPNCKDISYCDYADKDCEQIAYGFKEKDQILCKSCKAKDSVSEIKCICGDAGSIECNGTLKDCNLEEQKEIRSTILSFFRKATYFKSIHKKQSDLNSFI